MTRSTSDDGDEGGPKVGFDYRSRWMTAPRSEAEDLLDARIRRTTTQESTVDAPVRTIHLCAATTKRPTTLLAAIDRSIAELTKSGRVRRPVTLPDRVRQTA